MNSFDNKVKRCGLDWHAMVRYSDAGDFYPVMDGDSPKAFTSRNAAYIAGLEAIKANANGHLRRHGKPMSLAILSAEAIFKNGRKITVEPKQRRFHKIALSGA